jgi:hypothetical protein
MPTNRLIIRMSILLIFLCLRPSMASARQMELHAAVKAGAVSVRIDFLGGAMGDRMKVFLRKQVAGDLQISVASGTLFLPQGANVQRLAAVGMKGELTAQGTYRRSLLLDLADGNEHGLLIQVVCIDYDRSSPPARQAFLIGEVDARCQRILSIRGDLSIWAYQSAIWMDRAGVSPDKLQGTFNVTTADLQAARGLLDEAEAIGSASLENVNVSVEAKVSARGMFSSDPAIRAQAHAKVQSLDESDRKKLEALLTRNVFRGGKLPTIQELRAGSTLESLIPAGIELPKLEIPQSVDDVISMLQSIRDHATTENVEGSKPLAQLESLRLLPHLTGLKAKLPLLRIAAARVIATVNDPVAVEALIVALKDSDARVRAAAATGLEKLTGKTFGEDAAQWEAWWQEAHTTFKWPQ